MFCRGYSLLAPFFPLRQGAFLVIGNVLLSNIEGILSSTRNNRAGRPTFFIVHGGSGSGPVQVGALVDNLVLSNVAYYVGFQRCPYDNAENLLYSGSMFSHSLECNLYCEPRDPSSDVRLDIIKPP